MFADWLTDPPYPLTSSYLYNIKRPVCEWDWTLTSLGMALLKPRERDYKGIAGDTEDKFDADSIVRVLAGYKKAMESGEELFPTFLFYSCVNWNGKTFRDFENFMQPAKRLVQIEEFVKAEFKVEINVLIREDVPFALIVAPSRSPALYHMICSCMSVLYPSIFKPQPLTNDERNLVFSMKRKTKQPYCQQYNKHMSSLRHEILKFELAGWFKNYRAEKIKAADREVDLQRSNCERLMKEYGDAVSILNAKIIKAEGLRCTCSDESNSEEQELVDYLSQEPHLHNITYDNGILSFNVQMPLVNFDIQKWHYVVKAKNIYENYGISAGSPFESAENRKLLLDSLFGSPDPEIVLRMWSHYNLNINRGTVSVSIRDQPPAEFGDCVQNPHHALHGCVGEAGHQIMDCLRRHELCSAVACCVAATGNVNIEETDATFRPMLADLFRTNKRVIERKDGVTMTPAETLLWLKEKLNGAKAS